jgi:D-alanyl-D-alanine carboxypeptidase
MPGTSAMVGGVMRAVAGLAVLATLVVAISSGCGGSEESTAKVEVEIAETPMGEADAAKVDETVTGVWAASKTNVPALYVGVWDPEKGVFTKAYGDAAEGRPATIDDSFRIGSVSKTFTAIVALQLVEDGKLALDDTVADVAPGVAEKFPEAADRTIEQLLSMHSGISDYLNTPDGIVKDITADPNKAWDPDELIAGGIEVGVGPAGEPGGYSTTNYILLQEIVEEATGDTLAERIKADVTDPLALPDTFLPPNDDTTLPEPAAHSLLTPSCQQEFVSSGANAEIGTDLTDWSSSYGQGGGGMTSTLADLGRWAASGTGDVLLPDDLVEQRNQTSVLGDGVEYGLGLVKLGGWYGHGGEALGWENLAVREPKSGVVLYVAGNSCGIGLVLAAVVAKLYPDIPLL